MTVTPAHPGFHSAQTKMSLAHYTMISLVRLEAKSLSTSILDTVNMHMALAPPILALQAIPRRAGRARAS